MTLREGINEIKLLGVNEEVVGEKKSGSRWKKETRCKRGREEEVEQEEEEHEKNEEVEQEEEEQEKKEVEQKEEKEKEEEMKRTRKCWRRRRRLERQEI